MFYVKVTHEKITEYDKNYVATLRKKISSCISKRFWSRLSIEFSVNTMSTTACAIRVLSNGRPEHTNVKQINVQYSEEFEIWYVLKR